MTSEQGRPLRTILVTGGCGYLGARLIRDLATDPALGVRTVRVLDNMQGGHFEALMDLPESEARFQFQEGDILDPAALRLALKGVDAVIHLAAIVRTPMSFDHPIWVEQVNHWGTARLVEACLEAGVPRFVYASSTAVYGPGGPYREVDVPRPLGPYAQSKHQAEHSVLGAVKRGLSSVILRFGTMYGRGPVTRYDAVVNRFGYLAGVRRALTVFGDGEQRRAFVHVGDAASAVCRVLARPDLASGTILNAVSENVSVNELVDAVRTFRPDTRIHYTDQDILTHQTFLVDGSRLREIGWVPAFGFRDGLGELLGHFRSLDRVGVAVPDLD